MKETTMTAPNPSSDADMHDRIRHDFTNHPPATPAVGETLDAITGNFIEIASTVIALVPPGRERSLCITKLEEASMWAKAGVARNQPS